MCFATIIINVVLYWSDRLFLVTHLHNGLVRALVITGSGVIILGLLLMVVVGSVRLVFGAGNVRQLWLSLRWDRLNSYLIFHDNKINYWTKLFNLI